MGDFYNFSHKNPIVSFIQASTSCLAFSNLELSQGHVLQARVMIPYLLSEKYTKKRKICVAGPPRSLFGPVSMFSGLTPFPPIRDGRIPQFVKPWLYSSSKMIPRCKEDHKISIRELYDFLLVFFASYWKRWTMRRSCRCPLWGFKNYQMQFSVIWCLFLFAWIHWRSSVGYFSF